MFRSDIELNYLRIIDMPDVYLGHYNITKYGGSRKSQGFTVLKFKWLRLVTF